MTNDKPAPVKRYGPLNSGRLRASQHGRYVLYEDYHEDNKRAISFAADLAIELAGAKSDYAALEAKYQRLVGVVEKVPHAVGCAIVLAYDEFTFEILSASSEEYCDCWKSDALREAGE